MAITTDSIIKNNETFKILRIQGFDKDVDPQLDELWDITEDTKVIVSFDLAKLDEFLEILDYTLKLNVVELHFMQCSLPTATIAEFFSIINSKESSYQSLVFCLNLEEDTYPIFCENLVDLDAHTLGFYFPNRKMSKNDLELFSSSIAKNKFVRSIQFDRNMLGKKIPIVLKNFVNTPLLEAIDLSFSSINDSKDVVDLLKLPQLKTLELSYNNLGKENFDIFCEELSKNKTLETLSLRRIFIDSNQTKLLLNSLKSTQIKSLDLESNSINSDHAESLKDFLVTSKTIERLDISSNKLDLVVKEISLNISKTPLKHLKLRNCDISFEACCQLLDGINENSSLVSLDLLMNNLIHEDNLPITAKKDPKVVNCPLEQLSFALCKTEKKLAPLLSRISFANLRDLDFSGAKFSVRDMKELNSLIERNRKLKTINLDVAEYDAKRMVSIFFNSGLEVDINLGEEEENIPRETLSFRDYLVQKRKTILKSLPIARNLIKVLDNENFPRKVTEVVCDIVLANEYMDSETVKSVYQVASQRPIIGQNRYAFLNQVCNQNMQKEFEAFQEHNAKNNYPNF